MKLTIIPADKAVYKDGLCYSELSLSGIPSDVHALQWNNTKGLIEFCEDSDGNKPANEPIIELPDWADAALAVWEAAKIAEEAAIAAAKELAAQNQPVSQGTQDL